MQHLVPTLDPGAALSAAAHAALPMVGFSGNTVGNWLADNVLFVIIIVVAIVIATFAITKKPRDAAVAFGIVLLALLLVSIAAYRNELGDWVRTTFFGG